VLLKKYGKAEQFLYSLFVQFGVHDTFVFFESRKLPLIVEANNRTFPKSQKAEDVVTCLLDYMKEGDVTIRLNSPVTKIESREREIVAVTCGSSLYHAKEYIVATGGLSHQETGSTGDGFKWLQKLGHTIVEPTPTVVPLSVSDVWVRDLAGVSLPLMAMSVYVDGKKQLTLKGGLLFTHFGISGPLILNNAYKVADLLHTGVVTATVDLFPGVDLGVLEKTVITVFDAHKNKELKNVLKEIVPEGVQKGVIANLAGSINVSTKVHSITKDERKKFVRLIKALPFTIEGLMGFDKAVVADGGVPLEEIDLRTMRSKKVSNLFITGDLLHINRPSGGYSLQLCWSTGYVAGSNSIKK
jgi:predicted Rossmann fold flavoprotein